MKVYMKPIEMIAAFSCEGKSRPYRFKLPDTEKVIKVGRIDYTQEEKLAGNRMFVYRCRSIIDGAEKIYELKYELNTCKWFLFKM